MAIAFINSVAQTATVNVSVTITATTAGNGLLIFIGGAAGTISSPAMSGETLVDLGTKSTDATLAIDLHGWCVKSLASGGSKTFTATVSGNFSCGIMEVSGQDTTDFYLTSSAAFANGSGGSHTVNVTTGATGQAVVGFGVLHGAVPTAGANYTMPSTNMGVFGTDNFRMQYDTDFDSGAAGAKAFDMGNTTSNFWAIKGYAIKPGSVSTTPITVNLPADSLAGGELL